MEIVKHNIWAMAYVCLAQWPSEARVRDSQLSHKRAYVITTQLQNFRELSYVLRNYFTFSFYTFFFDNKKVK